MKKLIVAAVAAALVASVAPAIAAGNMATGKKHHAKRYHTVTRDGYYKPGLPKRDPGRYSNLPGKDAQYSKAYLRDH